MKLISLFSGCGGLDLGFENAGFKVVWANDNASSVWATYESNFPNTELVKKSIRKISLSEIPDDIVGVIGGPPCQSWSNAGKGLGIEDSRGTLFFNFIEILTQKKPLFFLAENVEGMLSKRNRNALDRIVKMFKEAGYNLYFDVFNSAHYNVPQLRKRVFFIGYREDLKSVFAPPKIEGSVMTVRDAIEDLQGNVLPAILDNGNKTNGTNCIIPNHEYWLGDYSYIFMSRNRVLSWDKPSYTLQASGRQTCIHPRAPKMERVEKDVMRFVEGSEHLYRRLSVRECARIQTFPDQFTFRYEGLNAGYRMIGNAVPVNLAYAIAKKIKFDLFTRSKTTKDKSLRILADGHSPSPSRASIVAKR